MAVTIEPDEGDPGVAGPADDGVDPLVPAPLADPPRRYDAFVSYSHHADERFAPRLQTALQRLAKPWNRRRALDVFRDRTGLVVSPGLWPSICAAMDGAQWLVLLASPDAAGSRWVGHEIERWRRTRDPERILLVVTDGEIRWDPAAGDFDHEASTAVHPALWGAFAAEPLHLDLRWARDEARLTLADDDFRDAVATLASPMHGIAKEDLESQEVRQQRVARRLRIASTAVLVVALVAGVVAVVQYRDAEAQRAAATLNQVTLQADRAREADPSLAAALDHVALTRAPGPDREARLVASQTVPLSGRAPAHAGGVNTVAHRPDGRVLASAGVDGRVRLWDTAAPTGPAPIGPPVAGAVGEIYTAGFGADGRVLMTGGADGARLWDVTDPARPTALGPGVRAAGWSPSAYALRPDGRVLAVADDRGGLALWDLTDPGRPVVLGAAPGGPAAFALAFSPDGRTLAAGGVGGELRMIDVTDAARPAPLGAPAPGHSGLLATAAFSPDGRVVATGGYDSTVRLWDVADRARPVPRGAPLPRQEAAVVGVAFSRDGAALATASTDRTARVFGVADPRRAVSLGRLDGHGQAVASVSFGTGGWTVVTGGIDGDLRAWDLPRSVVAAHTGAVVAGAATGGFVATSGADARVRLWRAEAEGPDRASTLPDIFPEPSPALAFTADGRTLATALGPAVVQWRLSPQRVVADRRVLEPAPGVDRAVLSAVAYAPDGRLLAAGTRDGGIRLWDAAGAAPLGVAPGHTQPVSAVAFAGPDTLVSAGLDGRVLVWDLTDQGRPSITTALTGPRSPVLDVVAGPDGRTVAAAGGDKRVWWWDLRAPGPGLALDGPALSVNTVDVGGDGRTLAAGSVDGTVRLWDVTDPARPAPRGAPLAGGDGPVRWLGWSGDGRRLLAGGNGGTLRSWEADPAAAIARLCAATPGVLTPEVWRRTLGDVPFDPPCR